MDRPILLAARGVAVGWDGCSVLSGVDLSVVAGETTVLVGPNGSGKSTLLRALLGLARPLAGTITRSEGWRAGYVPQRDVSAPLLRLSAIEVVAMAAPGPWLPFAGRAARHAVAVEALSAVSLQDLADRTYRDLSGGQRQRVLLARALAASPSVLVLDEPTSGLDVRAERDLLRLVERLRDEHQMACLIVTHSLDVARREADVVGLLHDGRCRVGIPDELLTTERLESIYGAHA